MIAKIIAFVGPLIQLLNTIFGFFKKSPQEERDKILKSEKEKKDEFEKTGRPK